MIDEFWCNYDSDSTRSKVFTNKNTAIQYAKTHPAVSNVQHWVFDQNHKNPKCLGKIWTKP